MRERGLTWDRVLFVFKISDMSEVWRDIPGYEDLYQASDLGRIKGSTQRGLF